MEELFVTRKNRRTMGHGIQRLTYVFSVRGGVLSFFRWFQQEFPVGPEVQMRNCFRFLLRYRNGLDFWSSGPKLARYK